MTYEILKLLHVIGATVLFGTGAGIAFFMAISVRTQNPASIGHVASIVVLADMVFTASAVILQPITGFLLAQHVGWPILSGWVLYSLLLYGFVGLFWLPVVWIQIQLRDMALEAAKNEQSLPLRFHRLYRIWFVAGFPAFLGVIAIFWLMIAKPNF